MISKIMNSALLCLVIVFWTPYLLRAQPELYNHPELDWYSIETEHFFVHFHQGAERTAKVVAKVAEAVFNPVTALYQFQPKGKYHFIIRDHDDYSNGAAFYYDNKIEIWAAAMDFELRGTHNWLRNVVTHEFTHMIQLQSARKITQRIPAFYFQAIGYETERREDVLHGGPNFIASYPLAMITIPGWFAEGVAQYQIPGLDYDTWDSHRDMILRTAILDNRQLTYNEMGVFGKSNLGNEKVYNHGYAFVFYLASKYGLESLRQITRNMKGFFRFTLDGALKKTTGKSGHELYADWISSLQSQYAFQTREILQHKIEGEIIQSKGSANLYPRWSPDGTKIAYLTNQGRDYLSQTKLVVKDLKTGKIEEVGGRVAYSICWSPDGTKVAFGSNSAQSRGGSRYYDIYTYDLKRKKKNRETKSLRAHSPNWSPDGSQFVYIFGNDGTENLGVVNLQSREIDTISDFKNGEQLSNPQWSANGRLILFTMSAGNSQKICLKNLETAEITTLLDDPSDARDAVFSPDGRKIYFSWDKSGIFNIYSMDLHSNATTQWTNVTGGAFMPSINQAGELAFSLFTSDGYKISVLKNPQPINESKSRYLAQNNDMKLASIQNVLPKTSVEEISIQNFDDSQLPNYQVKPYKNHYSPIAFLPRMLVDYGTLKLGSYFYSYDILNKYGFLAGFDVNRRGDYDLFALIEYKNLGPTIFLEIYNQVQNTSVGVDSTQRIVQKLPDDAAYKFKYNLAEVDAGVSIKLGDANELRTSFIYSRYGTRVKIPDPNNPYVLNYKYFIGRDISIRFTHDGVQRTKNKDINPNGRFFSVRYDREFNKFLKEFSTERAIGIEEFTTFNYNKVTLDWKEYWGLPIKDHTINLDIQAGFIDIKEDSTRDGSFFYFFGGGLFGNRGYPYFSIEGKKMILGRFTYRFPLFSHIDMRFMHLYFDKIFLGLFYDYGNAFNENKIDFSDFKSTVGVQLRLDSFSFYSFPTRIFFNAAYALDKFQTANQMYGKEWSFYFGLSFGYLD